MITRKVDREDASPAGFAYDWVKKLGKELEVLYVLTWQKSDRGDLPENIKIISLPNFPKIFAFQWYLLKLLPKIDGVFCHQNPEYTILSFAAKIFRKKIVSWYTHKTVNLRRRLMELLADAILTASDKSFRQPLFPKKVIITGHGIDVDHFKPARKINKTFRVISIGRISPVKNYETLLKAVELVKKKIKVKIIGQPILKSDQKYLKKLKQSAGPDVDFVGGIPHNQILPYYQNCDLFVNLSQTGSLDKAVLEAMACGKLVLTSNEAFKNVLKDERLMFQPGNSKELADKIVNLMSASEDIGKKLREIVVKNHNLTNLVKKIIQTNLELNKL